MFDIGFSEMILIAIIALVVLGPEKLPRVARTVGTLLGKAQRYVADVKAEVNRSMELDELRKMNAAFVKQKKQAVSDCEAKLLELSEASNGLRGEIALIEEKMGDHRQVKSKLDKLREIRSQLDAKGSQLKSDLSFFNKHDNCPTCMQKIDEAFKCETVESKNQQLTELENGLELLSEKYAKTSEALNEIIDLQSQVSSLQLRLSANTLSENHIRKQVESYQQEIRDANKAVKESGTDKLVDLETELSEVAQRYNDLYEDKQVLSTAASLLKDGGIKTKIINQYIPIINKLINKYLSEFDLFVEFHLDEQFNETIKSRYRDEFSYASFSEGEKQKIDLAILFTWRAVAKLRNSLNTNVLLLDEVFDSSLDGNAADDLLKILNSIAQDTNVFIISHRENLFEKFNKTIKFNKHKNFSAMEGTT